MRPDRYRPLLTIARLLGCALCLFAAPATAQECAPLGEIGTDGTGAPARYRVGGTYLSVPIERITPDHTIQVRMVQGPLKYVTLHARYLGGIWKIAHQGPETGFPGSHTAFAGCRAQAPRCTDIIFSINGAHERYEPLVSRAALYLCAKPETADVQGDDAIGPLVVVEAPLSNWRIRVPADWDRSLEDNPQGGGGSFTSPDGLVVLGVITLTPGDGAPFAATVGMFEQALFGGQGARSVKTATLGGLNGEWRTYRWIQDGLDMAAEVFIAATGGRHHVVWGVLPVFLPADRGADLRALMSGFSLLETAARQKLPPAADQTATSAAAVVLLIVGDAQMGDTRPVSMVEVIGADAPQVIALAALSGAGRVGAVDLSLFHLDSDTRVATHRANLADLPPGPAAEITLAVTRPMLGWPPGLYRVSIQHDGKMIGSKMFMVEEAVQ